MEPDNTDQLLKDTFTASKIGLKEIQLLYPKIQDRIIPLTNTDISARVFFNWKAKKLIDLAEFEKNDWVRLNIFQYVWLKIIEELRYFGVSLSNIKKVKEFLFTSTLDPVLEDSTKLIEALKNNPSILKEQIEATERIVSELKERGGLPSELKIIETNLGAEIISTLIRGTNASLVILVKGDNILVNLTSFNSKSDIDELLTIYPNIQIPLKRIIGEIFEHEENATAIETLGLINVEEKQVLDALRDRSFKEITIKNSIEKKTGKNSLAIEVLKEADLIDEQKIKQIKRMLGLNEFSEIVLKLRNDKHVYIKNKVRLK